MNFENVNSLSKAMFTIPDSFNDGTKTMRDMASVHKYRHWFRRDFSNGAKLRRADL